MIVKSKLPKLFGASGLTIWPFIFMVDPTDAPLLAHEKVHYEEQAGPFFWLWWIKYLLSKSFRQAAEVRAYKVQISSGMASGTAAYYLAHMYGLGITLDQAYELLTESA